MLKGRIWLVQLGFICLGALLIYRLLEVQLFYDHSASINKIKQQQVGKFSANPRVNIVDRDGSPLAVSIEQYNLFVSSSSFVHNSEAKRKLLFKYLSDIKKIRQGAENKLSDLSTFLLAASLTPSEATYIRSLQMTGIWADRNYKRYYPAGEAAAQLVGFVNNENNGIEGLELLYDEQLKSVSNNQEKLKDGRGGIIRVSQRKQSPKNKPLQLSIDMQLQYLAYQHLLQGCSNSGAKAGIIVTLDSHTGEVLAIAQYPSFNPNNRKNLDLSAVRNRALTDVFEPGSTFKPLILAAILEEKGYPLSHKVDTAPGYMRVGGFTIRDGRNYGELSIDQIISKSSNVGISMLSRDVDSMKITDTLYRMGVGRRTGSQFPGEREGYLPFTPMSSSDKVVMSYGYGVSLTPMQLAKAYGVLANGGEDFFVSFTKNDIAEKMRVIDEKIAASVLETLKGVVGSHGTGRNAKIPGYEVA
ncbi:MAG: penicillin-binding protein 2, partial [Candidatus Portiera sp.]|nr:penicillin-binding protein 2 [Portiera sp.]